MKFFWVVMAVLLLAGCATPPPRDVNNLCTIFKQYPDWYRASLDVQKRWLVPVTVQMAIMHQESKFDANAMPPRTKLLWVIPWTRPSSAYGYAQALRGTWALYKKSSGGLFASRDNFSDGVDFMGWYANEAYKRARIPRNNTFELYLAYHEGIGGYQQKTYLKKPWLVSVAHKVSAREQIYRAQLASCSIH
jgi:hypothetical protein